MNKLYINGTYLKKNPQWHTEDSLWKASQIIKIIENNKLQFQSICEVGCGAGLILVELQKCFAKNIKFYGYDISPQAIELAYKLKNENLNFYLEDFVKKRNQQFDIILCIDVLEHIEDFYGFLKNIKRKGTYKIFHVPLEMNVQKIILQRILKSRKQSGHIHYFMKETALETLRDTGYKVIDWFYTPAVIDCANHWLARIGRFPVKILFKINKDITVRMFGAYSLLVLAE